MIFLYIIHYISSYLFINQNFFPSNENLIHVFINKMYGAPFISFAIFQLSFKKVLFVRERPFNLKGEVMVFCFVQNFFFGQHESRNFFFCRAKREFFFQNSTLGYMTKTLNQIIFFSLHQNQNIFFSNIGNQNIFFRKKTYPFKLNGRSLIIKINVIAC